MQLQAGRIPHRASILGSSTPILIEGSPKVNIVVSTCSKDCNLKVAILQGSGQGCTKDVHTLLLLQPPNVAKQRH